MCFSAQVWEAYGLFVKRFGASVDFEAFVRLYADRRGGQHVRIPKGMDAGFADTPGAHGEAIRAMIAEQQRVQSTQLETELFKQRQRLTRAERALQNKPTQKAREEQRIASNKIERARSQLADLRRSESIPEDSRIFPGSYAPVMLWENGQRVLRPMRYGCRPAGKPADYDRKYPGTYNARRDNLTGFWKQQFGHTHGVIVVEAFYENVSQHRAEQRELAAGETERNLVLEFRPRPAQPMLVACLWSHWTAPGQPDLYSFAAITDEPPSEIAAAGHDRCIIPIQAQHLDDWLRATAAKPALDAILDDRDRPYYEHRRAA